MPKIVLGEKMYSRTEVAELLGVTIASVTNYFKDGLKSTLIGGTRYVTEPNLKEYLNKDRGSRQRAHH